MNKICNYTDSYRDSYFAYLIDRQPRAFRVDERGTDIHVLGYIGCHLGCTDMPVCRCSSGAQDGGDPPKMVKMDPRIDDWGTD